MQHLAGVVVHIHNIVRVHDFNALGQVIHVILPQNLQNRLATAHQYNLGAIGLGCIHRAHDRRFGCEIATHGIENNLHMRYLFLC